MNGERLRVAVVDDHPVSLIGLAACVLADPRLQLAGQADSAAAAVKLYEQQQPDILLMDMKLGDGTGLDALAVIRASHAQARVVIVTGLEGEEYAYRAMRAGVNGYLEKTMPPRALADALCSVASGATVISPQFKVLLRARETQPDLTARETDVLRLLVEGRSNAEIGRALDVGIGTVRTHVASILRKLGAADRTEAATAALRRGLVT
jgi:DNA-binding NarL/FixJ family response regulator